MEILVTGAAGFIGFHLTMRLLKEGFPVIGLDNVNSYYDKNLKLERIKQLKKESSKSKGSFLLFECNLEDTNQVNGIFEQYNPTYVVNLAAQAGVRYSIENPKAYISSNILGFSNILECCRNYKIEHLIYASSSSVYGGNTNIPFSETASVDHPISLYAATKKSNELMAHCYSHLYGFPSTGLRFFTVYGPWGRPDMALFLFTKAIVNGEPIKIFNRGDMIRDFTYIDDIVESLFRIIFKKATKDDNFNTSLPNPSTSFAAHRVFNIGNSNPIPLMEYISAIEMALGIEAIKEFLPMQAGDVQSTSADTSLLEDWINFKPNTSISLGVSRFISWYKKFYKINK